MKTRVHLVSGETYLIGSDEANLTTMLKAVKDCKEYGFIIFTRKEGSLAIRGNQIDTLEEVV